ncbi:NAD(P)/FAD-dependent oxidoreductase [Shewanella subflava]|uniref:FAD-binding oxidoreductase n=1 Tax=Shewanella subflava TaxID=2986476 RepID=A0ABT3I4N6_9GAMM|nr:FAD-dependent oxidoreductase [Shewanella subflava]MCW3170983.1 FAD-binding oxidoreductase [Shewanella subflava]
MDAGKNSVDDLGDMTVIGAGIVGLASALYLQRAGFKVSLFDKEAIAAGASQGNAGHFATEQVFPLANPSLLYQLPSMLLDPLGPFRIRPTYFYRAVPWFMKFLFNMLPERRAHNSRAIKALNEQSIKEMQDILTFCDCEELLRLNGSLLVFEGNSLEEVKREWQMYSNEGVDVELLTGQQVRELEPSLTDNITHALFFTQVGHTPDPYQICLAIADKFKALGGVIKVAQVDTINGGDEGVSVLLDGKVKISSNKLLLTAGAWSKPLAKQLGHNVPLEAERGYHLMMPQDAKLSRPVASYNRKLIITPMAKGTRLAGTVEFGGVDAPMSPARADCLLPHAKALLPNIFEHANVQDGARWMGCRPSFPDSLPVIGKTKVNNIYVSFGHQHLGLTWSAISAKLITETILDKKTTLDMQPYSIDRFR